MPLEKFSPTQVNIDDIVSAAIRLVRLQDYRTCFMAAPPNIGTGEKRDELEKSWVKIVKARNDLNRAVRKLKSNREKR